MSRTMAVVLFTDLVGSTGLRGHLGEEAADELRRKHDQLLAEAVERNNGRVVKGLGDGIMATFSGASDAVAAAVAIQQQIDRLNRTGKAPVPLEVRVGLSAGDVSFEADDVHGAPVIEASRLCGAAVGGEVLASEVVRWLGGQAAAPLTPVGSLELKGLAAPVPAVRVEWEPAVLSTVPLPSLLTVVGRIFVGRDALLERLGQLWKEAAAGERRVALLAGEPGVGKTRLAAELAARVHAEGGLVLAGRCDEDMGVPYQPFVEALRHYVSRSATPTLGRHRGELARLVPELAELVAGLPQPLRSDPETERYRLFDAVAAWLSDASAESPTLLVIDDLHWAAKPTLLLLRHVLRSPEGSRFLVVATYRDTDIGRGHPLADFLADVPRFEEACRLQLSGLDVPDVAAFVERAAGHRLDEEGMELAHVIWQETEGNAFFVSEMLRHLAESGAVELQDGRWVVTRPLADIGVPEGVRDVVGRRLSRLSAEANRLLACAAVIGLEFDSALVGAVSGVPEDLVVSGLEEAIAARLVLETPGQRPRSRFTHSLVRATLYEELSATRRVTLHRKVAEAIETVHGPDLDDHLPALAHHWARASAPGAATGRAVEYARRAGDRALAQFANDEAAAYFRDALELLDVVGVSVDDARRLPLLISLGEAQRRAGDVTHRETLLNAAGLADRLDEADALARAALANTRGFFFSLAGTVDSGRVAALEAALAATPDEDSATRAGLLSTLSLELTFHPHHERTVLLSDEAVAMARRISDADVLASVLIARCSAALRPDTLPARVSDATELAELVPLVRDPATRARSLFLAYRGFVLAGRVKEAAPLLQAAEDITNELGQPTLRWMTLMLKAGQALIAGRLEAGERLAVEAAAIGSPAGHRDAFWALAQQLFLVRSEQGRFDRDLVALLDRAAGEIREAGARLEFLDVAVALAGEAFRLDRTRAAFERISAHPPPSDMYAILHDAMLGQLAIRLAEHQRAEEVYARLRNIPEWAIPHPAFPLPAVSFHLGVLAAFLGRFDEADEHFSAAEAEHQRIEAPGFLARTRLEWARMLLTRRQSGDGDKARELGGQALTSARELGLAKVESDAAALLA